MNIVKEVIDIKKKLNALLCLLANENTGGEEGGVAIELDPTVPEYVKAITQDQINTWNDSINLYMALSEFVSNGKIKADKIESLALVDLVKAEETSLLLFRVAIEQFPDKYTFQENDFIAIPNEEGNYSLYLYTGEDKVLEDSYLPTGLVNITMSMIEGLSDALDTFIPKSGTNQLNGEIATSNGNFRMGRIGNFKGAVTITDNNNVNYPNRDLNIVSNIDEGIKSSHTVGGVKGSIDIGGTTSGVKIGASSNTTTTDIHVSPSGLAINKSTAIEKVDVDGRIKSNALVLVENTETLPRQLTFENNRFKGTNNTGVKNIFQYTSFEDFLATFSSFSSSQNLAIANVIAGGTGSPGNPSVNLISPPIIQTQYNVNEYVLLRGANLNLGIGRKVELLQSDKTTVIAEIPDNQVQTYDDGLSLVFYYNFSALAEGQYFIRLTNGVKVYTTSLDLRLVQALQNIDLSTITWDAMYDANSAPLDIDVFNAGNFSAGHQAGASATPKTSIKSSEIFQQGDDFLIELTLNLLSSSQFIPLNRSFVGIGYSSTQNNMSFASQINFGYESYYHTTQAFIYNNNQSIGTIPTPTQIVVTFIKTGNVFRTVINNSTSIISLSNNEGYCIWVQLAGQDLGGGIRQILQGQITKAFKFN